MNSPHFASVTSVSCTVYTFSHFKHDRYRKKNVEEKIPQEMAYFLSDHSILSPWLTVHKTRIWRTQVLPVHWHAGVLWLMISCTSDLINKLLLFSQDTVRIHSVTAFQGSLISVLMVFQLHLTKMFNLVYIYLPVMTVGWIILCESIYTMDILIRAYKNKRSTV